MRKELKKSGGVIKKRGNREGVGTARSKPSTAAVAGAAEREQKGLPPLSDVEAEQRGIKVDRDGLVRCRVCGCTEREPCFPPCGWRQGEADLCDRCHEMAYHLRIFMAGAHRFSKAALLREVKRLQEAGGEYLLKRGARR
jgi:hypothetical protein